MFSAGRGREEGVEDGRRQGFRMPRVGTGVFWSESEAGWVVVEVFAREECRLGARH